MPPNSLDSSFFDGVIPPDKREPVLRAIRVAFGNSTVKSAVRLAGGASGPAAVFRISVNDADFLLRIEGQTADLRDPARQYACLKIAGEAGVAPRLVYADEGNGVAITDFIHTTPVPEGAARAARLQALVETVKTLHRTPLFPGLMPYLECIDILIRQARTTGILPAAVLQEHLPLYGELASVYPRRDSDSVSSHNDLNPSNVLFAGERPWIVDWESAFAADRYVDIAAVANFFADNEADEDLVLRTYFGSGLDQYHRARFFLMQQANRMFYAMVLLNSVAATAPATRLTAACLSTPRYNEVRGEMALLATHNGRLRFGCVFLTEVLYHLRSRRFAESVALCHA
jgi:thiamine kinase-like enzyme